MPTSIRLPVEIERRLDLLAQRTGRTKAFYIREIILKNMDALESAYLGQNTAHVASSSANKVREASAVYTAATLANETAKTTRARALSSSIIDLIVKNKSKIIETCKSYKANNVRIFGSCARGDYDEKSDVDFLVSVPKELGGFDYINALCDLEEALAQLLGIEVDVVDEASLQGSKRNKILKEAIVL